MPMPPSELTVRLPMLLKPLPNVIRVGLLPLVRVRVSVAVGAGGSTTLRMPAATAPWEHEGSPRTGLLATSQRSIGSAEQLARAASGTLSSEGR